MWARKDALLGGHALGARTEVVEAGLADARDLRQGGQRVDLGERLVEGAVAARLPRALPGPAVGVAVHDARAPRWGAGRRSAWTLVVRGRGLGGPAGARQVAADLDDRGRRRPTAALARPSSTVPDCMSRWVCESATGTRSGSGSGGAASRTGWHATDRTRTVAPPSLAVEGVQQVGEVPVVAPRPPARPPVRRPPRVRGRRRPRRAQRSRAATAAAAGRSRPGRTRMIRTTWPSQFMQVGRVSGDGTRSPSAM